MTIGKSFGHLSSSLSTGPTPWGGRPSTHHQGAELAGTALEIGLAYEWLIFTEKHSFLRLGRRHVRVEYSVENRIT